MVSSAFVRNFINCVAASTAYASGMNNVLFMSNGDGTMVGHATFCGANIRKNLLFKAKRGVAEVIGNSSGKSLAIYRNSLCVAGIMVDTYGNGNIRALASDTCTRMMGYAFAKFVNSTVANCPCSRCATCTLCRRNNAVGIGGSVL